MICMTYILLIRSHHIREFKLLRIIKQYVVEKYMNNSDSNEK